MAFCLGPALLGTSTLLSVNSLTQYFPWRAGGIDIAGHEVSAGDTIDAAMPGIAYVRTQLFSGHLASWQGLIGGGAPLASVPDLGLLDPLSLPYFVLPLWLAPAFVVLLTWIVAIGGTFLFLRRLSLSRPAAWLAGFIFATSGFMVMWTNWPQARVAALIPALFWAVERLIQRTRLRDIVILAVVIASMLFGGFPTVTGYALYMATGYLVVRIWILHRGAIRASLQTAAMAAGGLVLGLLLSAVQMLPFYYFYQHADLAYRSGDAQAGLPLWGLVSLVAPNANGLCISGQPAYHGGSPVELVAYVGAAAFVLAITGAAFGFGKEGHGRGRGVRGYFVGAALLIIILAWASPTARSVISSLPVFAGNFIGRIRSVLGFALAVLAAIGFDWLTAKPSSNGFKRRLPTRVWAAVVWIGALVAGILVLRQQHRVAFSGGYWSDVRQAIWIPALLVVITLAVLVVSRLRAPGVQTVAFVVIPLLVVTQGAQFFHTVQPGDNSNNFYPNTSTHQFLESHLGNDRFASSGLTMYPSTALYYGLRTPTGHTFVEPAWKDLLVRVDPAVMLSPTFSDFSTALNQNTIGHQPILDQMGVRYFVLPPGDIAGAIQPQPRTSGSVISNSGPVSCTLPGQPLRGVTVRLARTLLPSNTTSGATVNVSASIGGQTIKSGRFIGSGVPAGIPLTIAIPGENIPRDGSVRFTFTTSGAAGPLVVDAAGSAAACSAVLPQDDGLKLVFADAGSVVYQRLDALPRIRWASQAIVIGDPSRRIAALAAGVPANTVVLDTPGPPGSATGKADVVVASDSGDKISARVTATGSGYSVVADAMQQPGWRVTVDGKPSRLIPADDAMVAVLVPSGTHQVDLTYRAPNQVAGAALSGIGVILAASLIIWTRRRRSGPLAPQPQSLR